MWILRLHCQILAGTFNLVSSLFTRDLAGNCKRITHNKTLTVIWKIIFVRCQKRSIHSFVYERMEIASEFDPEYSTGPGQYSTVS